MERVKGLVNSQCLESDFQSSNRKTHLDFAIIGAQKSGTTALFRYLTRHNEIFIPGEKEIEFFSDDRLYSRGLGWYFSRYFGRAPADAKWGEASTHYMMYPDAPKRIASSFPQIYLIALLRNPIDRAYSHYRMTVRRGKEKRTFAEAISECCVKNAGRAIDIDKDYVAFGLYGSILSRYLELFPREQLCVHFTEEMESRPAEVVGDVLRFIGVSDAGIPENVGERYHESGSERFHGANRRAVRVGRWLKKQKWCWRPEHHQRIDSFLFWFQTELNLKKEQAVPMSKETRLRLTERFAEDVKLFERVVGVRAPWSDWK